MLRRVAGKEFHKFGAATSNVRLPKVFFVIIIGRLNIIV